MAHSGRAYEDVDAAQTVQRLPHYGPAPVVAANVPLDRDRLAARITYAAGDRRGALRVQVGHGHTGPLFSEELAGRLPYPGAATRHQGRLAFQPTPHLRPPHIPEGAAF